MYLYITRDLYYILCNECPRRWYNNWKITIPLYITNRVIIKSSLSDTIYYQIYSDTDNSTLLARMCINYIINYIIN